MPTKSVIIDDTHPHLAYEGEWKLDSGLRSWDLYDDFGKTLYSTVHLNNGSEPASFSFTFQGSSGRVVGTSVGSSVSQNGDLNPVWSCSVDGKPTGVPAGSGGIANNWFFCEWEADEGVHVLNVNISRKGTDQENIPFLFDYISYNPPKAVTSEIMWIPFDDPSITYDGSWATFQATGMRSSDQTPSTCTLTFNGTGVQLLGEIPGNEHWGEIGTATYSLDGGQPVSFNIRPQIPTLHRYNQQLVDIPSISPGTHNLTLSYSGNKSLSPLIINAFIVRNQELAQTGHPSSTFPQPTMGPIAAEQSSSMPVAAIAALSLGAAALLASLGLGWWFLYRPWARRHRREADTKDHQLVQASTTTLPPTSPFIDRSCTPGKRPKLKLDMSMVPPAHPPSVTLPREKDLPRQDLTRPQPSHRPGEALQPLSPGSLAIQEVQHADSGLRILDGVVTYVNPPAYGNNTPGPNTPP